MKINGNAIQELSSFDILGTSALSDTIVGYIHGSPGGLGKWYINMQSGVRSSCFNNTIRDGRSYIFIDNLRHAHSERKGMLARYFPEYGTLLAAFYSLTKSFTGDKEDEPCFYWDEVLRVIISFDEVVFINDGKVDEEQYDENMDILYKMRNAYDLCGQFIHTGSIKGFNISGTSGDEVRQFTGNVCWEAGSNVFFNTFHNICDIYVVAYNVNENCVNFGMREINMDCITVEDKPLPGHVVEMIGKMFKRCLAYYTMSNGRHEQIDFLKRLKVGYLQNCGGEYVLRVFAVAVKGNAEPGSETMPVRYVEIKRVHITDEVLKDMKTLKAPLIYFDREGIDDGVFRYAKKYLEEAEKDLSERFSIWYEYHEFSSSSDSEISIACAAAFMPFVERLLNMFSSGNAARNGLSPAYDENPNAGIFKLMVKSCRSNLKSMLCDLLGGLDFEKKELNQVIGIPRALMKKYAEGDCDFNDICVIKDIFSGYKEYFMSIDTKTLLKVIQLVNVSGCPGMSDPLIRCLKMLISIFGINNIYGYCEFLACQYNDSEYSGDYGWVETYLHYLEKLETIGKSVAGLQWKLKGHELERADEAVYVAYATLNDNEKYADTLKKFRSYFSTWEKYKYRSDRFTVTYPQGPTDLVEEGVKLNHCAKTFINRVADGETIILFIRKNRNLTKPFYTLEIRNDGIRQCHGFNNCNIEKCDGLTEFIKKFAEEKHLFISKTINETLGVE